MYDHKKNPYFSNIIGSASGPTCCNGNITPYITGIMPSSISYSFTPPISNLNTVCAGNYTLTANSPSCTMTTTLTVGCLTGMNELEKSFIRIYPNPAISELEIDIPEGFEAEELFITNYLGQEVMRSSYKKRIDISGLAKGAYFLTIKFALGMNYHTKFIKE